MHDRELLEAFEAFHVKAMREIADHLMRNFRGEVDVISGKLDRLRERIETMEGEHKCSSPDEP